MTVTQKWTMEFDKKISGFNILTNRISQQKITLVAMFYGVIIILGTKICRIYQYRNSQYRIDENVAVLTHLVTVLTFAVKKYSFESKDISF